MKRILCCATFLLFNLLHSQIKENKPFINIALGTTFGINQYYRIQEEGNGLFIVPKSIVLRTDFGYQFDKRWATSISFGYDHHFTYNINAIPYYGNLRYNFGIKDSQSYFVETSFGQMWRPSRNFSNGNYYRIGVGLMSLSSNRWNGILRIDFHRKKIAGFTNNNLDSVSISFGFSFM